MSWKGCCGSSQGSWSSEGMMTNEQPTTALVPSTAEIVEQLKGDLRRQDPQSGEVPAPDERARLLRQAGSLKLTKVQRAILSAPATDDVVDVLPTGEVYVSGCLLYTSPS